MGKENLAIIFLLIATTMVRDTWARASGDLLLDKELEITEYKAGAEVKKHPVGGDKGWDLGVDYAAWAATQDVKVGDRVYFRYDKTKHNVYIVKPKQFEECSIEDPIGAYVPGCGSMSLPIGAAGDHYFISGVGDDCKNGMKVKITATHVIFGFYNLGIFVLIATTMVQATWVRVTNNLLVTDIDQPIEQDKASLQIPNMVVHAVGGDKGWDVGVDYVAWAASRDIRLGDKLYFRYDKTKHNIYMVHPKQFEEWSIADPIASYVPGCGSLSFILTILGEQLYISGAGNDCKEGMKVRILVKEKDKP